MTGRPRSGVCVRAHVWASLLPDGELSLFERRLLDAHCVKCPDCRQLRDDVASLTTIVRGTPLAEIARPVRVPSARLGSLRPAASVLASGGAAALAFVLAVWIGPQVGTSRITTPVINAPVIILVPERSTAEIKAIWNVKRSRGAAENRVVPRRPGPVLS